MNLSVQQEGGSNVSFLSLIKASNITLVFLVVLRVKSARLNLIDGKSALMIQNTLKPVSLKKQRGRITTLHPKKMKLSVQLQGHIVSFLSIMEAGDITLVYMVVLRGKSARQVEGFGESALWIQDTLEYASLS